MSRGRSWRRPILSIAPALLLAPPGRRSRPGRPTRPRSTRTSRPSNRRASTSPTRCRPRCSRPPAPPTRGSATRRGTYTDDVVHPGAHPGADGVGLGATTSTRTATTTGTPGDQRRYSGFREDAGKCSQAVIFSKDIAPKRAGRADQPRRHLDLPQRRARTRPCRPPSGSPRRRARVDRFGPEVLPRLPRAPRTTATSGSSSSGSGTPWRPCTRSARRSTSPSLGSFGHADFARRLVGQLRLVRLRRPARRSMPAVSVEVSSCVRIPRAPSASPTSSARRSDRRDRGSAASPVRSRRGLVVAGASVTAVLGGVGRRDAGRLGRR